jgi:hypothetical protein
MSRKILAISWAMPPLIFPRALQISRLFKQWSQNGHKITVLSVLPESLHGAAVLDPTIAEIYRPFYRTVGIPSSERSLWFRAASRLVPMLKQNPDEKRLWAEHAVRRGIDLAARESFDIIVSFAQPWSSHVAGWKLKLATGLPWVAHFSDPWAVSPEKRTSFAQRQAALWESRVMQTADGMVFVNRETADATLRGYPNIDPRKIHVVNHGFDRDLLNHSIRTVDRDKTLLRIVHSGNFYDRRNPWGLLQALADLNARGSLTARLQLIFVGSLPKDFQKKAAALGLQALIQALGPKSYLESLGVLESADGLVLIEAADPKGGIYFPSKLVDYLPFEKPILGLTPAQSPAGVLLRQLQCPVVNPDDSAGIQSVLENWLDRKQKGTPFTLNAASEQIAAAYDIQNTARAFEAVLNL